MRITTKVARLTGLAVAVIAIGHLTAAASQAQPPHGGSRYDGRHDGGRHDRGRHDGGYGRPGYGHWPRWPYQHHGSVGRPGGVNYSRYYIHPGWAGGYIYDRPGDGLPPLPATPLPGGGWVVNRPGDGFPPIYVGRPGRPW